MAGIEPIASAMTFQAQPLQPAPVATKISESMEGQPQEINAPVVDGKTLSVSRTQESAQESDGNESQDNGQKQGFDSEMMKQAMQELNKKAMNVEAEFGIHEKTNRITIKMVDKKTKEVIKELPPEKMLDMIARMWEISGLVVDEKR